MKTLTQRDLEVLRDKMMLNNSADVENHYDVTIKLIEIVRDQQAEIELLKKQISQASNTASCLANGIIPD